MPRIRIPVASRAACPPGTCLHPSACECRLTAAAPPPPPPPPPAPAPAVKDKNPAPAPPEESYDGRWSGIIGVEGVPTGDGRMIERNALRWDDASLPMPLRYAPEDLGAHAGAQVVGRITGVQRLGSGMIWAEGDFDQGSPIGMEAMRQVYQNLTSGISMDLDEVAFEYRISAELAAEQEAAMEEMEGLFLAMTPSGGEDDEEENPGGPRGSTETDADGRVTVMEVNPDDEMEVTTGAQIRSATIVSIPAFKQARIGPWAPAPAQSPQPEPAGTDANPDPDDDGDDDRPGSKNDPDRAPAPANAHAHALAAAAAPADRDRPPAAWFADPHFAEPTPVTVTDDGRVRGHIAEWGTCHTGYGDQCVTPPRSAANYAYFRLGALVTKEGTEVPVGRLTMSTRHADASAGAQAAMRHYDDTGTAVADVAAGEDEFGIWVAGALRPGLTPAQVRELRSSPMSGDWRRIGGNLELVAALAVNVPGFPVPRTSGLVASGRLATLLAAGMVPPRKVLPPGTPGALPLEDLRYLRRLIERDKREKREAAAAFASTVRTSQQSARRAQLARMARTVRAAAPPPQEGKPLPEAPAEPEYPAEEVQDSKPDMSGPSDASWIMGNGPALAVACNSALDEAVGQLAGVDTSGLPEPVAQAIGLMYAAWSSAHLMLPALGVPDPDASPMGQHASRALAAFSRAFAEVDDSPWDAGAAMDKCHSAADFGSIAFPRTDGDPDSKGHWALPHHSGPGEPPNASGVSHALGRFGQTQGLKDPAAAKAHLEAHDSAIKNSKDKAK